MIVNMGRKILSVKERLVTTNDGQRFVHRITAVEMPNGKTRYPEDYYDPSETPVLITEAERQCLSIPVYQKVI